MPSQPVDPSRRFRPRGTALAVLLTGIVASSALFVTLRSSEREHVESEFLGAVDNSATSMRKTVDSCFLALEAIQAFYAGSERVDREEFHEFALPFLARPPKPQALVWVPVVHDAERTSHESAAARGGGNHPIVDAFGVQGRRRATRREVYLPISYIEPASSNEKWLGVDLATSPEFRRIAEQSGASGEKLLTSAPVLPSEEAAAALVCFVAPVFQNGVFANAVRDRREEVRGFLAMFVPASEILEASRDALIPAGLDLDLVDRSGGGERLLARHASRMRRRPDPAREPGSLAPSTVPHRTVDLELPGERWALTCAAAPAFFRARFTWQPWVGLACGLLLTVLVETYVIGSRFCQARTEAFASRMAEVNRGLQHEMDERKDLEAALQASIRRYQLFAENASDVFWTMTFSGRFEYASPSALPVLGYTPEELTQLGMEQIVAPASLATAREHLERLFAAMGAGQRPEGGRLELQLARKDGSVIWGDITYSGMYDESGKIIVVQGVTRDITQRRRMEDGLSRAEAAARRENAKLTAMISGMEEGVLFADSGDVIVEINDYFCRFVDKSRADILGKRIEDFHAGKALEVILRQIDRFRSEPGAGPFVVQRRFGDAEVILRMQPVYRDGRYDGVLLNVIDVSGLVKARRQAEAATRAKSQFLASMSHEIRTPLTSVLGYADLLTDPTLSPSTRDDYLAVIRRSGEHLLELINDILDLSKIEAGKLSIETRPCHVVPLVADVASLMRPRAEQRGIHLVVEYGGEVPETILTDEARLRQSLVNLVGNAVKFTEHGEVRVVVTFLPAWRDGRHALKIDVVDTGIGIRSEVMAELFQPFTQGDATTMRKFGGTGLGLAISHHLAELLGGELTAASIVAQGSTFTLVLPTGDLRGVRMLERPAEILHDVPGEVWCPTSEDLRGARILLAEDGLDNQELIALILRKAGAEVQVAENGRVAVEMAEAGRFDVVLMDMNMPEMDGYEATRLLRDREFQKPILALTANAMAGDRQRCLDAGCNDYVAKPIDRQQLILAIAEYLGRAASKAPETPAPAVTEEPLEAVTGPIVSQYAADPDMATILAGFVARLPAQVDTMRQTLQQGAFEDLQRAAHKLKGSGGSYGYASLTEASRALETAAMACDEGAATAAIDRIVRLCGAIHEGFSASVPSAESVS